MKGMKKKEGANDCNEDNDVNDEEEAHSNCILDSFNMSNFD